MAFQQHQLFTEAANQSPSNAFQTIGTVVDTNDPMEHGRLRVVCTQWGDTFDTPVDDIPWAMYVTPFGGHTHVGTRGPGLQSSTGGVAYGMWAIPKVGAQVLIGCVDGNTMTRIWLGCVFDPFVAHTLPHGRYLYDQHPALNQTGSPVGPLTSSESPIEPLSMNMQRAFGEQANHEFKTRGADYQAAAVSVDQLNQTYSNVPDDDGVTVDNWVSKQGYQTNRLDSKLGDDSTVYSLTTPGFHSLSMDDRQENCRIRMRTTSGSQVLLDDTNERIYVSTAGGSNWIEMDYAGNIDLFTTGNLSGRASGDINLTSDESIRLYGKKGVHIVSDEEIRITTPTTTLKGNALNVGLTGDLKTTSASAHINADNVFMTAGSTLNLKGGSAAKLSGGDIHISASGAILNTGSVIHLNGPSASPATTAQLPTVKPAFYVSRLPTHEPFARCMTKDDNTISPEFAYADSRVNRVERGKDIPRGMFWRR